MTVLLNVTEGSLVDVVNAKGWYAWTNLQPPPPNNFHVVGEVLVPNPGVKAILTPKEPQGINPTILLLDLILVQQPGFWPQVITWVPARYDKVVIGSPYKSVQIFSGDTAIAEVPVEEVH
jgi:hypothetical protein